MKHEEHESKTLNKKLDQFTKSMQHWEARKPLFTEQNLNAIY